MTTSLTVAVEATFVCTNCGSSECLRAPRPDLTWKVDGKVLPLPIEVPVTSCSRCHEAEYSVSEMDAINAMLRPTDETNIK